QPGENRLYKQPNKDMQPAMPCLAFFSKREELFVSGKKHQHTVDRCHVQYIVNPERHMPRVKHYQLKVALQARAKGATRWVGDLAGVHLFRPEAFMINHGYSFSYLSPFSFQPC